ncbi:IS1182 family transposase [Massilia cavernae]|uniref:IS1182 family transposase n=1 Tax=Massilia cavernae TaxID=2320864 RepID=UPI001601D216|nr:IS1182 family transposase [Massilia cavernae]
MGSRFRGCRECGRFIKIVSLLHGDNDDEPDQEEDHQESAASGCPARAVRGFPADEKNKAKVQTAVGSGRRFVTGNPRSIFLGAVRLEDHLKQVGQTAAFTVANLLDEQDWQPFEARYASTGRAPYAPRLMLGLILYGVMQGVHSLRELERLARLDLGCMWVTGGIAPDHANIGRFIVLHENSLTQNFFESLTRSILKKSGTHSSTRLAGDGTVIEAACSHYKLLREEAVKARVEAAGKALAQAPTDRAAQQELEDSKRCLVVLEARQQARKRSGRSTESLSISGSETEAMVQRLKRGKGMAASYKPSVLANEDRIITALAVDPSSETKVVAAMLDQSARVVGAPAKELLLDAGYFDDGVIAAALEREVSLLCPEGKAPGIVKNSKVFHKSSFQYDSAADTYRCPAGQMLIFLKSADATQTKRAHRLYGTDACGNCPLRPQCTKSAKRRIQRHPEDTERDALRLVMQQPQVADIFRQRKAMVEPVFSHLLGQQGLSRFRRKGLCAVRREFALHVLAYNLSRAVALMRAFFARFLPATLKVSRARSLIRRIFGDHPIQSPFQPSVPLL